MCSALAAHLVQQSLFKWLLISLNEFARFWWIYTKKLTTFCHLQYMWIQIKTQLLLKKLSYFMSFVQFHVNLCLCTFLDLVSLPQVEPGSCGIECKPVSSLYPKCHLDYTLRESLTARITHLCFLPTEGGDVLVVGAGDNHASHVELWHLTSHTVALHQFYQGSGGVDVSQTMAKWVHKVSITHSSMPCAMATPKLPVVYKAAEPAAGLFQYVAISYRDGSVKLVNRWGLHQCDGLVQERRNSSAFALTHRIGYILTPENNGCHLEDKIFKYIFLKRKIW